MFNSLYAKIFYFGRCWSRPAGTTNSEPWLSVTYLLSQQDSQSRSFRMGGTSHSGLEPMTGIFYVVRIDDCTTRPAYDKTA